MTSTIHTSPREMAKFLNAISTDDASRTQLQNNPTAFLQQYGITGYNQSKVVLPSKEQLRTEVGHLVKKEQFVDYKLNASEAMIFPAVLVVAFILIPLFASVVAVPNPSSPELAK